MDRGWQGWRRADDEPADAVGSYNVQQADGVVVTAALGRGCLTTIDLAGRRLQSHRVARSSHDACVLRL